MTAAPTTREGDTAMMARPKGKPMPKGGGKGSGKGGGKGKGC